MPGPQVARETDQALPLVLEGSGGLAELTRRKAMLPSELQASFEEAFRLVFTLDRAKRDATRAGAVVATLVASPDKAAQAAGHRLAGYLAINRGFDAPGAIAAYRQAIAVDPDYGEAHYALAFTLAISDLEAARTHFERAMALGVPDTRQLRAQFFQDAPKAP
jgi:tetratricopeptide (TPR) repeat protein